MTRGRLIALFAAVALAAAAAGVAYRAWLAPAPEGADPVERLFASRLAAPDGSVQGLAQWRGRVLVVNFWATWCAPCREEVPVFVRLQSRHGARGLQFVGIALDRPDPVAEFAREFGINYPVLMGGLDSVELMRQAGNRQGVLPYTLVIDRSGKLVSREPGGVKEEQLERLISPLL